MLVATLLDIGLGARKAVEIEDILDPNSTQTASAPPSAQGLFLQEIEY
jgi:tRNA U38,U39,U40 pseudouridine synthase TruA